MNSPELPLSQDNHPHPLPNAEVLPGAPDTIETPDVVTLHLQKYDTVQSSEPLPALVYLLCGVAIFLLGTSFAGFNFLYEKFDQGPGQGALATVNPVGPPPEDPPAVVGKKAYSNCAACHGANGAGQPGQYPPLAGSPYVQGPKDRLIDILSMGAQGDINVMGGHYNGQMPAFAQLNDKKLAALLTYIRSAWGNTGDEVKPEDITAAKSKIGNRSTSYSGAELDAMK